MNIFKRSILYIIRKKMRSTLLFMIFFLMGLFMLVSLSIRSSADRAASDMRKTISTGLKLEMFAIPGEKMYDVSYNEAGELVRILKLPLITETIAKELASIDGVSGYYSEMGAELLHTGLDVEPGMYTQQLSILEESETSTQETIEATKVWMHSNDFRIVQESAYHPHFANGALELVEGRHLHADDSGKIMISNVLAKKNHLEIGDYIEGRNFDPVSGELYGEIYRAEIIGIFRINFDEQISEWTSEPKILSNTIFGPFELRHWGQVQHNTFYGGEVLAKEEDRLLGSVTLFVEDPAVLNSVEQQVKENTHVDWGYYSVARYDEDYKAAAKPLLSMMLFATIMVVVAVGGSLIILSLILAMWMRGRRQEIHILNSIGLNRKNILAQFLVEISIVAVLAFLVSWILAGPTTRVVGNLLTELTNPAEDALTFSANYEVTTGITYVNRGAVRQEPLDYSLSSVRVIATFISMIAVSWGTILFTFIRMHERLLISSMKSDSHHWKFQRAYRKGALKAYHRAFLYVTRKIRKTTLLFLTIFMMMLLFLVGLSVRTASEKSAAQLRSSIGGYFKVKPDYRKTDVKNQVDEEFVEEIFVNEDIKAFNAMDICYMDVQDLLLKAGKFSAEADEKAHLTRVMGNTDTSLHEYFSLGIFELIGGQHIEAANESVALISEELAQLNNLSIGDYIELKSSEEITGTVPLEKIYKVEIIGVFSEAQQTETSAQMPECDIPANFIFTDIGTTQQILQDMNPTEDLVYTDGATFFVTDPKEIDETVGNVEISDGFDSDHTRIIVNNTAYQSSIEPLQRLGNMSLIMLILIAVVGVILLTLLLALWERDRIHEAGILMSFGISKRNILWQHFMECAVIFAVAFCISVAVFLPLGEQVGKKLYENISQKTLDTEYLTEETVSTELIVKDITFEVKVNPLTIVIAGLTGIFFIGISTGTAFLVVIRHKPKQLLAVME